MSLQDKIFDVQASLKNTPEADDFVEIMEHYYGLERERDSLRVKFASLRAGMRVLKELGMPV